MPIDPSDRRYQQLPNGLLVPKGQDLFLSPDHIRTYQEIKKGWWIETKATILCALPPDGQIVVFRRAHIEYLMDAEFPHHGHGWKKIWWFPGKDREIAEVDVEGRISCNPQVLWQFFMKRDS